MLETLIARALASQALLLANRISPIINTAAISACIFNGKRINFVALSDGNEAAVKARTGEPLTPVTHWKVYSWGGGTGI